MQTTDWPTLLNVLVAFLGVGFACFAFVEWRKLRGLREEIRDVEKLLSQKLYANLKAAHRVMASYSLKNPDEKIALLESAVIQDPTTFNAYNSLGYAYLDKGETQKAVDAFSQAVFQHPDDKAGYCDLAYAHSRLGCDDLCVKYLRRAVSADASALDDIRNDPRLCQFFEKIQ
ncbi:MAG: tetratricopeptide repeat protein [Desulfovibrio sp.]|jgi:tetratricopeptide (TPR) repeat protein|nr:tetratricopeptide repeat protein [Desulfovibrio sp.]